MKRISFAVTVAKPVYNVLTDLLETGLFGQTVSEVAQRIIEKWVWDERPEYPATTTERQIAEAR